jgi:Uma2 family endonuclease
VLLWEVPAATIRSPDAALFDRAPNELRPLPAFHMKVVVEVVSPGSRKADKLDKMAEYADAGIPFYWLVWLSTVEFRNYQTGARAPRVAPIRIWQATPSTHSTNLLSVCLSLTHLRNSRSQGFSHGDCVGMVGS